MTVSRRQLYFFLACVAPAGKLILLPARLAESAKNDLLLPAAIHLALQAAAVFCALLLCERGETLHDMLAATFGRVAAKIFLTVFSVFLAYAAFLPLLEEKLFVQSVYYDTLPSITSFAPFFLFAAYLAAKPIRALGRVWDILGIVAAIGYAGILILSAGSADYAALAPAGGSGMGILLGVLRTWGWFFDAALLLPLAGHIEAKRGTAWRGALFYLAGSAAVLLFLAVFYGIFQETATNQLFAIAATSKYFSGVSMLGRVDYAFVFLLGLVVLFLSALPVQGCVECLLQAYGREHHLPAFLSVGVSAVLLALVLVCDFRFGDVMSVISGTLFWIFPLFSVLVPVLCLALRRSHA